MMDVLQLCVFASLMCTGFGLQPADYESDWLLMESQSSQNYFREVIHGLGEVPIKVKVLVKPLREPYSEFMFEAGTSQQADDDVNWLYCGILYTYNVTHVHLFAPRKVNKYDGGRAFCIDSSSWTSGSNSSTTDQIEQDVYAKIMAWKATSFPSPDLDTGWLSATAEEPPDFLEIAHNLQQQPDLALLQVKCIPMYSEYTIYSEGVGAGSNAPSYLSKSVVLSGLVFAYSSAHIRVWNANQGYGCILCIRDGYARDSDGYRCFSGEFRVRAWTSLGQEPQQFSFVLNGLGDATIPDMSALKVNIKRWNPLSDYISVQVKALDGPNANFVFPAIGQDHRNLFPGSTYGGVMFGFSAEGIRLFVPANETGTMIHVPGNWGTAAYEQTSDNVEIIVKIWTTTPMKQCSMNESTAGIYSPVVRSSACGGANGQLARCTTSCLSEPNCVGVMPCTPEGPCQLMDLDAVNRRLIQGLLGTEGEALLRTMSCIARQP